MEEEHRKLVSRMIASAEGGAGSLHKITKPTAWRGGVPMLEEVEIDVKPLTRCEEKRNDLAVHWQCNTEVQFLVDKPWRNEKLRSLVEGLPSLREYILDKAARNYKIVTGIVKFLDQVEQCGTWTQQACKTMFFLIPKNVTSERTTALLPTLIRCWDRLRAPEVPRWQGRHRGRWGATDGRNEGAERTVWETLLDMERFDSCVGSR